MFCPYKNSYLQLVCAMNPRVINKAVDQAMGKSCSDLHTESPAAQRLESMQPSLYAPHVDITRARLGYGRIGLRVLNRELHSSDDLVQLQALHTLLDQVQISENAMFLINLQVVYRLVDLMNNTNPVVLEKVCLILTRLASYYQGRERIMHRPTIVYKLMCLIMQDIKEIRYAAACTLRAIARDRCAYEWIMTNDRVVEDLLEMIKVDHLGIILLHLKTLEQLTEWDPVRPLRANAFQIMLSLFKHEDSRVTCNAMDCMTQLCKHDVGKTLADVNDINHVLMQFLTSLHIELIISTVNLMQYTTLTTRSKWRAKEFCCDLTRLLVKLCHSPNKPVLQLRCMQVLINLCDCPDIRNHLKSHWEVSIKDISVRRHEEWDGTSETTSYGLETGHNYRTMCIEDVETIRNDYGDNAEVINVHSYLKHLNDLKQQLIKTINWKSYKN